MTFSKELLDQLAEDPIAVLNRGYRAQQRIALRQERIISWRQIAESITANPENSSGGGGPSNKIERCVLAIVSLEEEITDEITQMAAYESESSKIIEAFVPDHNYATVLELRYLSHDRWEQIAVKMGYTFRWTQELHRRAIDLLQENVRQYCDECVATLPK